MRTAEGRLVVVVDDDDASRRLVTTVLELSGHRVSSASDAAGLRQLLAQELPDVVLIDLRLPGTNGLELARELRRRRPTRNLSLVAVSAVDEHTAAAEAGFDTFLAKPFDAAQLLGALDEHGPVRS